MPSKEASTSNQPFKHSMIQFAFAQSVAAALLEGRSVRGDHLEELAPPISV